MDVCMWGVSTHNNFLAIFVFAWDKYMKMVKDVLVSELIFIGACTLCVLTFSLGGGREGKHDMTRERERERGRILFDIFTACGQIV